MWWAVLAAELLALGGAVRLRYSERSTAQKPKRSGLEDGGPPRPGPEYSENYSAPLVLLLALAVAVDVLLAVGDCRVLGDPRAALAVAVPCVPPAPRGGLVSAVVLGEQALAMAWPAALAVTTWRVFDGLRSRLTISMFSRQNTARVDTFAVLLRLAPLAAWLLAVAVLVLARPYGHPGADPEARADRAAFVARLLLGVELLAVVAGAAAVVRAWTPGRRWSSSPVHRAVLMLLVTELAVAAIGPFVRDPFSDWDYARALYLVGFGGVTWTLRPRRSGPAGAPP